MDSTVENMKICNPSINPNFQKQLSISRPDDIQSIIKSVTKYVNNLRDLPLALINLCKLPPLLYIIEPKFIILAYITFTLIQRFQPQITRHEIDMLNILLGELQICSQNYHHPRLNYFWKQSKSKYGSFQKDDKMIKSAQTFQKVPQKYPHFEIVDIIQQNEQQYQIYNQLQCFFYMQQLKSILQNIGLKLNLSDLILANQCLGCLQKFDHEKQIPKTNQIFSLLNISDGAQNIDEKVRKKACGILNSGGGYLFLTNSTRDSMRGFVGNLSYLGQYANAIIQEGIFPKIYKIIVEQVYLQRFEWKDINQRVIRVILKPHGSYLYFVKTNVTNSNAEKHSCKFIKNLSTQYPFQDYISLQSPTQFYSIIHKIYNTKNKKMASKIRSSKINDARCIKADPERTQIIQTLDFQNQGSDYPKRIHQYSSILIITSVKSNEKYYKDINKSFERNQIQYTIIEPFKNYHEQSSRFIYFLSHKNAFATLLKCIKDLTKSQKKQSAPIFLACTKYLMVGKNQRFCLIFQALIPFIREYKSKFKKEYLQIRKEILQGENSQLDKNIFYFKFETIQESVFGFVYLDNQRRNVQFTKKSQFQHLEFFQY